MPRQRQKTQVVYLARIFPVLLGEKHFGFVGACKICWPIPLRRVSPLAKQWIPGILGPEPYFRPGGFDTNLYTFSSRKRWCCHSFWATWISNFFERAKKKPFTPTFAWTGEFCSDNLHTRQNTILSDELVFHPHASKISTDCLFWPEVASIMLHGADLTTKYPGQIAYLLQRRPKFPGLVVLLASWGQRTSNGWMSCTFGWQQRKEPSAWNSNLD